MSAVPSEPTPLPTADSASDRERWLEVFADVIMLTLLGGGFIVFITGLWLNLHVPPVVYLGLLITIVVVGALFRRAGWLKVCGPLLFYDMLRSARRGRFVWLRCGYAGLLLFILFVAFLGARYHVEMSEAAASARMAQEFFEMFITTQLLAVAVLTPAYVAGSIAEEKDRKTLEFLLATDLRNREIVLSKLGARMANIVLFILTGLPLVSLLQFMGGVLPSLVQAGFAATALTMLGLAGVSILTSTWFAKPRQAIAAAYMIVVVYLALSSLVAFAQYRAVEASRAAWRAAAAARPAAAAPGGVAALPARNLRVELTEAFHSPLLDSLATAFTAGNLFRYIPVLQEAAEDGKLDEELPLLVPSYALFQLLLAAGCTIWAVLRLRRVALKQLQGKGLKGTRVRRLAPPPPVGNHPILWKEVFTEGGRRLPLSRWVVLALVVVAGLLPAAVVLVGNLLTPYASRPAGEEFLRNLNGWAVRLPSAVVGCVLLLAVAVRAANSFSGERDRQTLDSLLTTPLDSTPILIGKWLGSILSVRMGLLWLAIIWGVGIATGAMSPYALPLAVIAWLVFAAFAATLGLWFSVLSSTSLRATVWTIMTAVGVSVGHWLPWLCCLAVPMLGRVDYIARVQGGLTPPVVLGVVPFYGGEFGEAREWIEIVGFSLFGIFAWAVATVLLYSGLTLRFRAITMREEFTRPERGWGFARPRAVLPEPAALQPLPPPERSTPRPPVRAEEAPPVVLPVMPDWRPPARLYGATLVDETFEPPPPRPKPRPEEDEPRRG
jgi:ABC-type transport system involved in multi-copper enzyme maturation permease subunit